MAHIHPITDTDIHFKIDGITRTIINIDETKKTLVQNDHKSERLTFELPRYIDGHDMTECNVIQVHFTNADTYEKNFSRGVYDVDDIDVKGEPDADENTVVLSWLVSRDATKYVGSLNFVIRFSCITDGIVDYAWNTSVFKTITILEGIYNSDYIAEEYVDTLEQMKADIRGDVEDNKDRIDEVDEDVQGLGRTVERLEQDVKDIDTRLINIENSDTGLPIDISFEGELYNDRYEYFFEHLTNGVKLTVGEKYKVVFDGMDYECECKIASSSLGLDKLYLGNGSIATDLVNNAEDTGEPFFVYLHSYIIMTTTDGEHTIKICEVEEKGNVNFIFADSEEELPDPSTVPKNTVALIPSNGGNMPIHYYDSLDAVPADLPEGSLVAVPSEGGGGGLPVVELTTTLTYDGTTLTDAENAAISSAFATGEPFVMKFDFDAGGQTFNGITSVPITFTANGMKVILIGIMNMMIQFVSADDGNWNLVVQQNG